MSGDDQMLAPDSGALLSVRSLTKRFGGLQVFSDVSFDVERGSVVGLIGPNGAGKSTLIDCISGFLRPDVGAAVFDGRRITGVAPHVLCRAGITRTFQHAHLLQNLSVFDNVVVGAHVRGTARLAGALWRSRAVMAEEREFADAAMAALDSVGCAHLSGSPAGALTAGQQRLVSVARALASQPRLLLLDEPAAGLNEHETGALSEALTRLGAAGFTLLVIEHDVKLITTISHRLVVLANGGVLADGDPVAVCEQQAVVEAYLGTSHVH